MATYQKVVLIPSTLIVVERNRRVENGVFETDENADRYIEREQEADYDRAMYDAYGINTHRRGKL